MSIRDIKNRISSIKNIRQITKAMGLVSATKLQKMRTEFESSRQFFLEVDNMAENICSSIYSKEKNKRCIILITSDRGLCGGYNINVSRIAIDLYCKKNDSSLLIIGNGGVEIANRNNISPDKIFTGISENPDMLSVKKIADAAISSYANDYEIYLAYTKFYSAVKFVPAYKKILPLVKNKPNIIFEPDETSVIHHFIPKYISCAIFFALLEAAVCEQSARMMSMNAATDNANEIISNLTLKYNRLRQNQITQELTEIISGADALKN